MDKRNLPQRGLEAKQVLESPVFQEAMAYMDEVGVRGCRSAQSADEAWEATVMLQAITRFRAMLHAYVANGQAAAEELDRNKQARNGLGNTSTDEYLTEARRAREATRDSQ